MCTGAGARHAAFQSSTSAGDEDDTTWESTAPHSVTITSSFCDVRPCFSIKTMLHNCAHIFWLFLVIADGPDVDEIVKNDSSINYLLFKITLLRVFVSISNVELATVFLDESMQ